MIGLPTDSHGTALGQERAAGRRIVFLEAVRGVAACLVVVEHMLITRYPVFYEWTVENFSMGRAGVVAFFVVSGYVIPLSLANQSVRSFAIRRCFRLFPTYLLALSLVVVLDPGEIGELSVSVVVLNVLMLQTLIGAPLILGVAWTLSLELVYYVQSGVAKYFNVLDSSLHAGWIWLTIFLGASVAERATGTDLPVTFPMLLFCASLGHALHLRESHGSQAWRYLLLGGMLTVPIGYSVANGLDGEQPWSPTALVLSFIAGLGLYTGIAVRGRQRVPAVLIWLGAVSYAIYVLHPATGALVSERLALTDPLRLVLEIVVLFGAAQLVHRWIELPSISLGKRLSGGRRQTDPADLSVP